MKDIRISTPKRGRGLRPCGIQPVFFPKSRLKGCERRKKRTLKFMSTPANSRRSEGSMCIFESQTPICPLITTQPSSTDDSLTVISKSPAGLVTFIKDPPVTEPESPNTPQV